MRTQITRLDFVGEEVTTHCRETTVLEQLDPDSGCDGVLLSVTNHQPIYGQSRIGKRNEESHRVNNMDSDLGNNSKNGPGAT